MTKTAVGTEDGPQERLVRVLLGSSEPEDLGVMPITDAYELATELGLLLVDEDDQTVRIYDHGKLVYERDVARRAATRAARRIRRAAGSDDQAPL